MDMFDPRTMVMDYDFPHEDGCDHGDFSFAFNNSKFSDRVLHIAIYSEPMDSTLSPSVIVEDMHISSPILAARSPFFYKLFTNGMKESEERDVTLRINASEKAAFMELLNFMYSNNLTFTTVTALLDVLVIADKFDVPSCVRYCGHLLRNLPMEPKSVLLYLDLPSTILTAEGLRSLTVAAKQFYAVHYKDITKYQDEIHRLPLESVEAIISSDDLKVATEDDVYVFVIKWARTHYPEREDHRIILMSRIAKFIRFPYMTHGMLTNLLTCNEFDPEFAQEVVTEAISFNAEVPRRQHEYEQGFVKRAYKYQPVKMVKFEQPYPYHVVYVDLKRDVCASLFPLGHVCSEAFNVGGKGFYLSFQCSETVKTLQERSFRILLGTMEKVSISFAVDYEFAVLSKPNEKFVKKCHGSYIFEVKKTRYANSFFVTSWKLFIGKDSVYFIDDVFHLSDKLNVRELDNKELNGI
ncbi:BTB/POZ domain-containing protein POB1-like [Bidens hawaiensis]|uniref:BTB/POZ domain-containing protein POB1-like n=1 Tax=Bidens hawaiensis TaxID=980011 RepID=UPI00404A3F2B